MPTAVHEKQTVCIARFFQEGVCLVDEGKI